MKKTAFDVLIDHTQERFPHFEDTRGQADIAAAVKENKRLLRKVEKLEAAAKLALIHFRYCDDHGDEAASYGADAMFALQKAIENGR